jgi:hypothetical protein
MKNCVTEMSDCSSACVHLNSFWTNTVILMETGTYTKQIESFFFVLKINN